MASRDNILPHVYTIEWPKEISVHEIMRCVVWMVSKQLNSIVTSISSSTYVSITKIAIFFRVRIKSSRFDIKLYDN